MNATAVNFGIYFLSVVVRVRVLYGTRRRKLRDIPFFADANNKAHSVV